MVLQGRHLREREREREREIKRKREREREREREKEKERKRKRERERKRKKQYSIYCTKNANCVTLFLLHGTWQNEGRNMLNGSKQEFAFKTELPQTQPLQQNRG